MKTGSRPATWRDIEAVADRLGALSTTERDAMGWDGDEMLKRLRRFMLTGRAWAMTLDGEPEAIIAIAETGDQNYTWFFATDAWYAAGWPAVRAGRRFMANAVSAHGPIYSILTGRHPGLLRWMNILGARVVGTDRNARLFVFA